MILAWSGRASAQAVVATPQPDAMTRARIGYYDPNMDPYTYGTMVNRLLYAGNTGVSPMEYALSRTRLIDSLTNGGPSAITPYVNGRFLNQAQGGAANLNDHGYMNSPWSLYGPPYFNDQSGQGGSSSSLKALVPGLAGSALGVFIGVRVGGIMGAVIGGGLGFIAGQMVNGFLNKDQVFSWREGGFTPVDPYRNLDLFGSSTFPAQDYQGSYSRPQAPESTDVTGVSSLTQARSAYEDAWRAYMQALKSGTTAQRMSTRNRYDAALSRYEALKRSP